MMEAGQGQGPVVPPDPPPNPTVSEVVEVMEKAMNSIVVSIEPKSQWAARLALELFIPTISAAGYDIAPAGLLEAFKELWGIVDAGGKIDHAMAGRYRALATNSLIRAANKEGL